MDDDATLDSLYLDHVGELRRRYARVLAAQGWDAVVVHSGSTARRSAFDDQFWPFRPVPWWQHWVPLAEPDCALVVDGEGALRLFRTPVTSFWETPSKPETDVFRRAIDVRDMVGGMDGAAKEFPGGRVAFIGDNVERAVSWGFAPGATAPSALIAALDATRVTKTPYEVACLAEANRRARAGHVALRDAFAAGGASELDLHLLYLRSTAQDDAETPYKNIVALGPNAATLHHVAYGRRPSDREAESLLVDAGATCRGYAADVTRTWTRGRGEAADRFATLVLAMDEMQRRLCAAIRVGEPYERLHDASHREVAAVLRDLGIVRASIDEAVGRGVTRAFFPHGLGHSLGLQTHDVGCASRAPRADNPFLRNTSDIAAGQVFTIEPGIYFIEALLAPWRASAHASLVDWSTVDALAPLGGVRIEDDVHVLGPGQPVRNLTREHL